MKFIFAIALLLGISVQAEEIVFKKETGYSMAEVKFALTNSQDHSIAQVAFTKMLLDADNSPIYSCNIVRFGTNYLFFNTNSLSLVAEGETIRCVDMGDMPAMRTSSPNARRESESFELDEKALLKVCRAKQLDIHLDGDKGSSIYHADTAKADRGRAEFADLITRKSSSAGNSQTIPSPDANKTADDLKLSSVKGKLTEQSNVGWRFSYKLDASSVAGCKGKIILIQFVDEDGFAIDETMEMNVNLQPGENKSITGIKTIDPKSAAKVKRVTAVVK